MTRLVVLNFPATTATPVELVPTAAYAAGPLPLNVTSYSENGAYVIPDYQRTLVITNTAVGGITYVVLGMNVYGQLISESIVVTNTSATTVKQYYKIFSITTNASGTSSVGYGALGTSILVPGYDLPALSAIGIASLVGGTINYNVNVTLDPLTPAAGAAIPYVPTVFAFTSTLNSATGNIWASSLVSFNGIQVLMNTNNTPTTGTLKVTICQPGSGL